MIFQNDDTGGYMVGHLLVASPAIRDERFARTVTYICVHTAEGAMGIVINRLAPGMAFRDLLKQLDLQLPGSDGMAKPPSLPIYLGGPVETSRGFVLHSPDYEQEDTLTINKEFNLTATVDILSAIATSTGAPKQAILTLGYAGWGPGQLETELQDTGWLTIPADRDLVFDTPTEQRWERALAKMGASIDTISGEVGHA